MVLPWTVGSHSDELRAGDSWSNYNKEMHKIASSRNLWL